MVSSVSYPLSSLLYESFVRLERGAFHTPARSIRLLSRFVVFSFSVHRSRSHPKCRVRNLVHSWTWMPTLYVRLPLVQLVPNSAHLYYIIRRSHGRRCQPRLFINAVFYALSVKITFSVTCHYITYRRACIPKCAIFNALAPIVLALSYDSAYKKGVAMGWAHPQLMRVSIAAVRAAYV